MTTQHLSLHRKLASVLAYSILACASAGGALAANEVSTVKVRYADLDLSKPAGTQVLYRRIKAAAREVCGPLEVRSPRQTRAWNDCYALTVEKAIAKADRPMLSALHRKEFVAPADARESAVTANE